MADNEKKPGAATEREGEEDSHETEIDETLEETFPASDPPSCTLGTDHRVEPKLMNAMMKAVKQSRSSCASGMTQMLHSLRVRKGGLPPLFCNGCDPDSAERG